MTTVAEGIETQAQLAFVRDHNCTLGQGFLFSKPLSADEAVQTLYKGGFSTKFLPMKALMGSGLQRAGGVDDAAARY
jgi:hypothetical protein